eukprot:12509472-Ditylum_brightwellii.AAC.1
MQKLPELQLQQLQRWMRLERLREDTFGDTEVRMPVVCCALWQVEAQLYRCCMPEAEEDASPVVTARQQRMCDPWILRRCYELPMNMRNCTDLFGRLLLPHLLWDGIQLRLPLMFQDPHLVVVAEPMVSPLMQNVIPMWHIYRMEQGKVVQYEPLPPSLGVLCHLRYEIHPFPLQLEVIWNENVVVSLVFGWRLTTLVEMMDGAWVAVTSLASPLPPLSPLENVVDCSNPDNFGESKTEDVNMKDQLITLPPLPHVVPVVMPPPEIPIGRILPRVHRMV